MENKKILPTAINFPAKPNLLTPCEKYGLDVSKLRIDELFHFREYRRLYNIVLNDQTTDSSYNFRPNLIKQLYFLLQITPFIEPQLQQSYLSSIEQWYNSNDHKKIDFSKNLEGMLSNVMKNKTKSKIGRPKSSVSWDKNLNCFLRPYTAKLNRKQKKNQDYQNQASRPDSSKNSFNKYDLKSTCVDTNTLVNQAETEEILQKETFEQRYEDLCDIEEQWQRSRDFINNNRTIHPEHQPTYEKLMKIILKADNGQFCQAQQPKTKNYSRIQKSKNQSFNKFDIKKRNIYSAIIKRENTKIAAYEEIMQSKQASQNHQEGQVEQNNDDKNLQKDDYDIEFPEEEENTLSDVKIEEKKKIFDSDKRSKVGHRNKNGALYTRVNGMRIVRPFTSKQNHVIHKLDNYHHLQNHKRMTGDLEDQEFKDKALKYVKNKGINRKQMARRTQAKRLLNNLVSNPSKKSIKILKNAKSSQQVKQTYSRVNHKHKKTQSSEQLEKMHKPEYYSVKKLTKGQDKCLIIKQMAKFQQQKNYNNGENLTLETPFYQQKGVSTEENLRNLNIQSTNLPKKQALLDQFRFDPCHKKNIIQYNQDVLKDIEKIKYQMAQNYRYNENGINPNVCVSTDALIRALYVDEGMQNVQNVEQFLKMNTVQKLQNDLENKQNQRIEVFDRKYLMIKRGDKKKPKKKRKLKGSKSKKK